MKDSEREALARLCLMAAYADGVESEVERGEIRRIAHDLGAVEPEWGPGLREAESGQGRLAEVTGRLATPELRVLAYEMAVGVCGADGALNVAERSFLGELRGALGLPADDAAGMERQAEALVAPPILGQVPAVASAAPPAPPAGSPPVDDGAIDRKVMHYAILTGALELLPHSMATLAIIPLQMKMVYEIGREFGFTLDGGHIRDFLATAGVGLTSQVVEGFASRLVRNLAGRALGGLGRGLAGQATQSAFAFATTYALGQAARQYYAAGRRWDAVEVRSLFSRLRTEGRALEEQYLPQIQERARGLNMRELLPLVRG